MRSCGAAQSSYATPELMSLLADATVAVFLRGVTLSTVTASITAADRGHCEALLVPLLGQLICPELESVTDKAVTDGDHHETDADEGWVGSRLLRMQSLDDLPEVSWCLTLLIIEICVYMNTIYSAAFNNNLCT
jgi:hypothetical protein